MKAEDIKRALEELAVSCETIRRADKCQKCPLIDLCIEEYSIVDTIGKINSVTLDKMLSMAEEIVEDEEERSKDEYDRRWEAESDYWNDRRSDPDYNEYD